MQGWRYFARFRGSNATVGACPLFLMVSAELRGVNKGKVGQQGNRVKPITLSGKTVIGHDHGSKVYGHNNVIRFRSHLFASLSV